MNDAGKNHASGKNSARICGAYSRLCSLKQGSSFLLLYRKGKRYAHGNIAMYVMANGRRETRLGVSISKKNGNAVVRHRFQRVVKEVFRLLAPELKEGFDIVVRAGKNFTVAHPADIIYEEIRLHVCPMLRQAGLVSGNEAV